MPILRITESELQTSGELLIKQMSLFDKASGELLRIAKITPQLQNYLQGVDFETEKLLNYIEMSKKNPSLRELVSNFNLTLI
jgi:hypothetical protein